MKSTESCQPRLIIADDNIRDIGGHYFELANLMLTGADQLGYRCVLATHSSFTDTATVPSQWQVVPTFQTRRLVHWSLGVDGNSHLRRDIEGRTIGGSPLQNFSCDVVDRFRPKRSPQKMLRQWSDDLQGLLKRLRPTSADTLVINTGDDFAMLALASALAESEWPPLRIHVIFHFALYETESKNRRGTLRSIGRQIRDSLKPLSRHDVHLHATTQPLASQLRETESGTHINAIPYPTRSRRVVSGAGREPWKVVLAGLPRAEKGRGAIHDLLANIDGTLLKGKRFRVSMQMPAQRWQSMVPKTMHGSYQRAAGGSAKEPIEVMTSNLSTADYHDWLDTADLGLFLYEPQRYVARCSGVLLEMLARGVPVIVPDHCWLADQIRIAGGHRSIGFIYQDRAEIPDLLRQFAKHHDAIRARSVDYAAKIAARHCGRNTLLEMGLTAVTDTRRVA